jgi:L,D-peptidoglycan transpeptidase YkuD (ErfK/YbiS/YcfS/YnhG family)
MKNKKAALRLLATFVALVTCLLSLTGCSGGKVDLTKAEDSPEWVASLEQAQDAEQLFVVAAVGKRTAYVSMHQKDANGVWKQIITTPAFIGKNGLGKEKEGDYKTPVGTYHFNYAFGIAKDPGCALDYQQVTDDDYWSGDQREGYHYNEMVSIKDLPDLNTDDCEHIVDYTYHYQYCLNISYNEEGTPGKGSAIFLHCLGPYKPFSGGCVAIPKDQMITVMRNVREDCVVVIDSLKKISPETWKDWEL